MRYRLGTIRSGAPRRDYDSIYRRLHPRQFPFSAFERQLELHDLWPSDQQKFRDMVDTVFDSAGDSSNRQWSRP